MASDNDELDQVIGHEMRLLDPQIRASAEAVTALLHEDFCEFGASGRVWDRGSIVSAVTADPGAGVTVGDMTAVRLAPDVVLLTYRVTRPGGRLVAAVLNPASPWGVLDRPARRPPYSSGCFLPREDLLALGRRHGQARIHGALFAVANLPAQRLLGPVLEATGKLTPRLGAFQVLTVHT